MRKISCIEQMYVDILCVDLFTYYIRVYFSVSFPDGANGKESTC